MLGTTSSITLQGSAQIVSEFFGFGINSILFQRGIYPPTDFQKIQKYGLPIMVTTDVELLKYLDTVTKQLESWLNEKTLQKLVLIVSDCDTNEVLERWAFNIENQKDDKPKQVSDINKEIQAIIRQ